jgi:hypothetical protein
MVFWTPSLKHKRIVKTQDVTFIEVQIRKILLILSSTLNSVFHRFRQAKFACGGSILSSNQFLLLPQLPQKMELASEVVTVDSKIIISLPEI